MTSVATILMLWLTVVLPPRVLFLPLLAVQQAPFRYELDWDERLTQRGAILEIEENGLYQITEARWLDESESGGRHHAFVTILDADGNPASGVEVVLSWADGSETKVYNGEEINFPLWAVAPSYDITTVMAGDKVTGLGLGSIEAPHFAIHTSYRFTFREIPILPVGETETTEPGIWPLRRMVVR